MQVWQTFPKRCQTVSQVLQATRSLLQLLNSLLLAQKQPEPEPTVSKDRGRVPAKLQSGLQVALVG